MPGEVTDTEIIARLRDAYRRRDWIAVLALADKLEADDARGVEAIMRAVREPSEVTEDPYAMACECTDSVGSWTGFCPQPGTPGYGLCPRQDPKRGAP